MGSSYFSYFNLARLRFVRLCCVSSLALMLCFITQAEATPVQVYKQALATAASGHESASITALYAASAVLPDNDIWKSRMMAAAMLLDMKRQQSVLPPASDTWSANLELAGGFAREIPFIKSSDSNWLVGMMATLFPGAGHAWQGRWRDAFTAVLLVWPMLMLTLWAAKRRMGPVTVFFALITVWLWSGTVYSSISLAERGSVEAYLTWWQGLWHASGLPGQPW